MIKNRKKIIISWGRNLSILVMMLLIFTITSYADTTDQKIQNPTQTQATVLDNNNGITYKGNPKPDENTQKSLDAILASPYMPIDIMVNNQYLASKTDAFSYHGIIYVSLRSMVDLIDGSYIGWNQESLQTNVILPLKNAAKNLSFFTNSTYYINNGQVLPLPSATLQKEGAMIIPLDFMVELLGISMEYDPIYHIVTLNTGDLKLNPKALVNRFYGVNEIKDFSRLVYKEAGSTSYQAMHGVASVILNHVRHPYYPNSINEVIYELSPSGIPHYTPVYKAGFTSVTPNYNSVLAAKRVLRGENSVGPCIFFNTRPFKNRKIYNVINGIYFCY